MHKHNNEITLTKRLTGAI